MKKFFIIFCIMNSGLLFSQTAVNKITQEVCKKAKEPSFFENKNNREVEFGFGALVLEGGLKYKEQLYQENHINIDLSVDDGASGKLGELVAMEMLHECPEILSSIANMYQETNKEDSDNQSLSITGTITEVKSGQFYTIFVKDDNKNITELLYLKKTSGISNPNTLKGKKVNITYEPELLINPKTNQEETYNIIDNINY